MRSDASRDLVLTRLTDVVGAPDRASTTALVVGDRQLDYGELGDLIGDRARELQLPTRSLVVLAGHNSLDWIVSYLALLDAGHVPVLAGAAGDAACARLVEHWQPAAVVAAQADGWSIERHDGHAAAELHPDLALLMSTSGSTGSPKLVRLSHDNVIANARSIADFQAITAADRGITSLPLHYSFGLSVLHSHLVAGASVVVTDGSVVDPCFAEALRRHRVTNLAGVPHTWDLIERAGAERIHAPSMRFLAHAGGRMAPERVAEWAGRAAGWGVDWFTMYGQTEATARMSYIPPDRVLDVPDSIGRPIPGGEWHIEPVATTDAVDRAAGVGEIVYRGPNVMLGYAVEATDLALGREIDELRTGDLGRLDEATGFVTIVGRLSRRVKPYGVRVDLDDVEARLREEGIDAVVVGDDHRLVAAAPGHDPAVVTARLADTAGVPRRRCTAMDAPAPRLANGKVDAPALLATHDDNDDNDGNEGGSEVDGAGDVGDEVRRTYATVLGLTTVPSDATFVSLGGDSLSYVECSVRLEALLGALPPDWHLRPVGELTGAPPADAAPGRFARVDTTVVLRTIGILAVVSTHMRLRHVPGGAHLLLGVVGYNLARFLLPIESPTARLRAGARTIARVAVPTVLWTAALMVAGQYTWTTLSLLNNYIGPRSHADNHWHFWFIEVFTHLVLLTTVVMAVPHVWRLDRRFPYAFPLGLLVGAIALRLPWADMGDWYNLRFRTHAVAWFLVLGWLVQRSTTAPRRVATTVICLVTAPGVFMNPQREFFIAGGLILLAWAPRVPLPRVVVRPVATIAAASMWILISHFMIWPPMKELFIVEVAYPLTVLGSLAVWWAAERTTDGLRPFVRRVLPTSDTGAARAGARPVAALTP